LQFEDALTLLREIDDIYWSKGKKIAHIDLRKGKPDDVTLKGLLLGPTGNLRSPTLRKGRTLIIGFNRAQYEQAFA